MIRLSMELISEMEVLTEVGDGSVVRGSVACDVPVKTVAGSSGTVVIAWEHVSAGKVMQGCADSPNFGLRS